MNVVLVTNKVVAPAYQRVCGRVNFREVEFGSHVVKLNKIERQNLKIYEVKKRKIKVSDIDTDQSHSCPKQQKIDDSKSMLQKQYDPSLFNGFPKAAGSIAQSNLLSHNAAINAEIVLDDSDDVGRESVQNKTLLFLKRTEWLSDQHIYRFSIILKKNDDFDKSKHFIFDPLFFTRLSTYCNLQVKEFMKGSEKSIKKLECFKAENMHIPIRVCEDHWILITIKKASKTMTIFDSLNKNTAPYAQLIMNLKEFLSYYDVSIKYDLFNNELTQRDGYNCGVAVLVRIVASTLGAPADFFGSEIDLNEMRCKFNKAIAEDQYDANGFVTWGPPASVEITDLTDE